MSKTFHVRATPCKVVDRHGYSTTEIRLFELDNEVGTVDVSDPSELATALRDWAYSLKLPTTNRYGQAVDLNAWSVRVVKVGRWPAGYKQAAERSHTFVVSSTAA